MRDENRFGQSGRSATAIGRRALMKGAVGVLGAAAMPRAGAASQPQAQPAKTGAVEWVATTRPAPWQRPTGLEPDYHLLKHVSHFVRPGARVLPTASWSGYENQLAFRNPDGSIVVVIQNDMSEPMPVRLLVGGRLLAPQLPADSFSTIVVRS